MIEAADALGIAGGVFGGFSGVMLLRWAVNLFFVRINKREDRLDTENDKLLGRMQGQIDRLDVLLAECKANHSESERRVACLELKMARLTGVVV